MARPTPRYPKTTKTGLVIPDGLREAVQITRDGLLAEGKTIMLPGLPTAVWPSLNSLAVLGLFELLWAASVEQLPKAPGDGPLLRIESLAARGRLRAALMALELRGGMGVADNADGG